MYRACQKKDLDLVGLLIPHIESLSSFLLAYGDQSVVIDSVLRYLVQGDSKQVIDAYTHLVQDGISCFGKNGSSILHIAASCGKGETIEALVKLGMNLEEKDNEGLTPIHYAVRSGHINTIEKMAQSGANLEARDQFGFTPLQWPHYTITLKRLKN